MSLNVADLIGTLRIDRTAWNSALRNLPGDIRSQGAPADRSAAAVGSSIARRLADNFKSTVVGGAVIGAVSGVFQSATNLVANGVATAFQAAKSAVFDFNSTLQNADIGFTTMLGSGKKSRAFLDQLKAFAKATPFEFQGLVQNAQYLLGMGVSAKDVIPTLTALGDSTASVGGSADVLNNTIAAFGQTVSKGTLDMGNMQQLLQGGVPSALKVLASSYGVTTGKMIEMISAGKVQASDAFPRLIKGLEHGTSATAALGGMMDKQSATYTGALSNIGDSVQQVLAGAFKPLFETTSSGFQDLATWLGGPDVAKWGTDASKTLQGVIHWFQTTGKTVGKELMPVLHNLAVVGGRVGAALVSAWGIIGPPIRAAAGALATFLGPLLKSQDGLTTLVGIVGGVALAVKIYQGVLLATKIPLAIATTQQWLLNAALVANPIGIVVAAVVGLIAALVWWVTQTKSGQAAWVSFTKFLTDAWNTLVGVGVAVVKAIVAGWSGMVAWFRALPTTIQTLLAGAGRWLLGVGRSILVGLATGIALGFIAVKYLFTKFPGDVRNWLTGAAVWLVVTGRNVLAGLLKGIGNGYTNTVAWFRALPGRVADFFTSVGRWLLGPGKDLLVGFAKGYAGFWSDVARWFMALPGHVVAFFAGVGKWLTGPGRDLLVGFALGYLGFWANVGKFFASIPGKVGGFFLGAGKWLYTSGRNIVQGLLNGVSSLAGTIGSFFLSLLPSWIRGPFEKAMGINSPSKVFKQLGVYIGQGLGIGLRSTKDDISGSMDKVVSYVKAGYDKLQAAAKSAQKSLTAAQRRYDAMTAKQRRAAAGQNLADTIAGYKATIAANASNKGGKAQQALLRVLRSDNTALAKEASNRDKIAARLSDANDALQDAQQNLADFASSIRQGAIDSGSVVSSWSAVTDSISSAKTDLSDLQSQMSGLDRSAEDYQQQRADLAAQIAAKSKQANQSPVAAMIASLQHEAEQTERYNSLLARLKSQGLDDTTYQQLLGAGVDQGFAVAQDIEAGGTASVQQIAALQNRLAAAGTALGSSTAQTLYGAGVAMKQGIVDGLTADMSDVNAGIKVLQDKVTLDLYQAGLATKAQAVAASNGILAGMAAGLSDGKANSALDRALGALSKTDVLDAVKNASKKKSQDAGIAILHGLRKGLDDDDANSKLDKTMTRLGQRLVKTLRKELGIHSPSRVFGDLVGQHIPTGIIDGIDRTSGALDARISDLVSVPGLQGLGSTAGGRGDMYGGSSYSASSSLVIHGNVGWDPEEVARRQAQRQKQAASLAGFTTGAGALVR